MSRLSESVHTLTSLLEEADLGQDDVVARVLEVTTARRSLDLSDLSPREQADLIATRAVTVIPGADALADRIEKVAAEGRRLIVKFGIDPTAPDVHLGHAVPIIIAGRMQRMGHHVVFIIGDATAKIGDPSGRTGDRPPLTDDDIAANLSTYRDQVSPFMDFERAELRFNNEWLGQVRLPELLAILAKLPVSMALQREDFRSRLAQGQGLSMAEFLYSVAQALDSVAIRADLELGGIDQLLNLQMCRKVMEVSGQRPELVVTNPLIEGTDGTGAKMSKSKGNYVPLSANADEIYGRLMSVPDHLIEPYLRHLSEWTEPEVALLTRRREQGTAHPMALKRLLAGEVVAALHGTAAAEKARAEFTARFSARSLSDTANLPVVDLATSGAETVGAVVARELAFTSSLSAARRVAQQNGLRLLLEAAGEQTSLVLAEADVQRPLAEVVGELAPAGSAGRLYLKVGRKLAEVVGI